MGCAPCSHEHLVFSTLNTDKVSFKTGGYEGMVIVTALMEIHIFYCVIVMMDYIRENALHI